MLPHHKLDQETQAKHQPEVQQNSQIPPDTFTGTTPLIPSLRPPEAIPPPLAPLHNQQALPFSMELLYEQMWHPCPGSSFEPKLCGFLQKQGGPLRAWKQRWFTYEERKNQLFYYRTPHDVTPLGFVELSAATFTYPLKAEGATFHIKTPERTFILKAVSQDLMLYWLQQLQVKRWKHQHTKHNNNNNNNSMCNSADNFLPVLKSPLSLVGEGAANICSPRLPLTNLSIKHPLIEIQNSVHSLRKRSSPQSQSVFHVETPALISDTTDTSSSRLNYSCLVSLPASWTLPFHPAAGPAAGPAAQVSLPTGRDPSAVLDSQQKKKTAVLCRDTLSLDRTSCLQQDNQILKEEVKTQKVIIQ
ncbi:TBC1 domain family member 2A-like [Aulostomus maculatus]